MKTGIMSYFNDMKNNINSIALKATDKRGVMAARVVLNLVCLLGK